jgi:hypothetical protein
VVTSSATARSCSDSHAGKPADASPRWRDLGLVDGVSFSSRPPSPPSTPIGGAGCSLFLLAQVGNPMGRSTPRAEEQRTSGSRDGRARRAAASGDPTAGRAGRAVRGARRARQAAPQALLEAMADALAQVGSRDRGRAQQAPHLHAPAGVLRRRAVPQSAGQDRLPRCPAAASHPRRTSGRGGGKDHRRRQSRAGLGDERRTARPAGGLRPPPAEGAPVPRAPRRGRPRRAAGGEGLPGGGDHRGPGLRPRGAAGPLPPVESLGAPGLGADDRAGGTAGPELRLRLRRPPPSDSPTGRSSPISATV